MKRKINLILISVIILIIIVLLVSNPFKKPMSVVSVTCPGDMISLCKQTVSPFLCPTYASSCAVQATMNCSVCTMDSIVKFRSDGNYWIAWDGNNDGNLECYTKSTATDIKNSFGATECNTNFTNWIEIPSEKTVFPGQKFYGTPSYMFVKNSEVPYNYCQKTGYSYITSSPTNCVMDRFPTLEYGGDREIIAGPGNKCSCSASYTHTRNGITIDSKPLNWNQGVPGIATYRGVPLNPGDNVTLQGQGSLYFDYSIYSDSGCDYNECNELKTGYFNCTSHLKSTVLNSCPSGFTCSGGISANAVCSREPQCSVNECNSEGGTGYYVCSLNYEKSTTLTPCKTDLGEVCRQYPSGAQCVPPFSTLNLSTTKPGYSTEDSVIGIRVNIISSDPTITSGNVEVNVYDESNILVSGPHTLYNFNFQNNMIGSIDIPNTFRSGKYTLKMTILYDGKSIPINLAPYFRVASLTTCTLDIKNKNPTFGDALYVGNPVLVKVYLTTGNAPVSADNPNELLHVSLNNIPQTNIPTPTIRDVGVTREYSYELTFNTYGTLDVTATAVVAGVPSNTAHFSSTVNELSIESQFLDLKNCINPSTQTFNFDTTLLGQYINTTNTLTIQEPLEAPMDISSLIQPIGVGKYKFTYNFNKMGVYRLTLTSSYPGVVGKEPITPQIDVEDTCETYECTYNTDCEKLKGTGYVCSSGKCIQSNAKWTYYALIGGGVLVGIIVIILLINFYKKRANTGVSNISLGGL